MNMTIQANEKVDKQIITTTTTTTTKNCITVTKYIDIFKRSTHTLTHMSHTITCTNRVKGGGKHTHIEIGSEREL